VYGLNGVKSFYTSGNIYEIFDNSLRTFDQLPPQTYVVRFSKNRGFFLEKYVEIEINENKIYGVHLEKVNKVLSSFGKFNRNLGVILSGDKGIGKSLFAKLLAVESIKRNIPLIVVDTYIPGISSYLESIEQEVMVLFDEFDKTFGEIHQNDGEASPQAQLLGLFDGVSGGKKLFVITCNELRKVNDYLINRPGRFHYHFRFEYPSAKEISEYLTDKLPEKYYGEIDNVVAFSKKISLNYDCLRAIAFELSSGVNFKDAIGDLNIINTESERYTVTLHYANGLVASAKSVYIDLFSGDDEEETIYLLDSKGRNFVDVSFNVSDCKFDTQRMMNIITGEDVRPVYDSDDEYKDIVSQAKSTTIEYLSLSRQKDKNIHYMV